MNKQYLLECCVDSAASARCAKEGGADRLELCANLVIGGTTPSLSLYELIREQTDIRIHAPVSYTHLDVYKRQLHCRQNLGDL